MGRYALLLGGSGMIGSLAHAALRRRGYRTIAPVRSRQAASRMRRWLRSRGHGRAELPRVVPLDPSLPDVLREVGRVACVVNAAGPISLAPRSPRQRVHLELARLALDAARNHGAERFVHLGTAFVPSIGSRIEGWKPNNDYERFKRCTDESIAAADLGGSSKVILRPAIACHDARVRRPTHRHGVYRFWYDILTGSSGTGGETVAIEMTTPPDVPVQLVNEAALARALDRCLAVHRGGLHEVTLVEREPLTVESLLAMMSEADPTVRFRWREDPTRLGETMAPIRHFYPYISRPLDPAFHRGTEILIDGERKDYLVGHFRAIAASVARQRTSSSAAARSRRVSSSRR